MPGAEHRHTHPTRQDTSKFKPGFHKEISVEAPEQAFEINGLPTGPLIGQKLTPSNILTLQRTIGNQAVMRLLERSHVKPPAQPLDAPGPAMLSTSTVSASPLPALTPVIQRKLTYEVSSFKKLRSLKGRINGSLLTQLISTYEKYGKDGPDKELEHLAKLRELCTNWLEKDRTNFKKAFSIQVFQKSVETEIEGKLTAFAAKIGLAVSYLNELLDRKPPNPLNLLIKADGFLESGLVGKADAALVELQAALPEGTYPLVKSALIRTHIGTINPNMAQAIENPDFQQKDEETAKKGDTGFDAVSHAPNYNKYKNDRQAAKQKIDKSLPPASIAFQKARKQKMAREKGMVYFKVLDKMSDREKDSITTYTNNNYMEINNNLRSMTLTGIVQAPPESLAEDWQLKAFNRDKFTEAKQAYTQNTISGLNKMPP
jgi:hypothetical protein